MKNESKKQPVIVHVLEWFYNQALKPEVTGVESANELAQKHAISHKNKSKQIDVLIISQDAKSASVGFVTGLGGLITLPASIPANLSGILFLQIRMIIAIAILGGYDVRDDKVKNLIYACLADTLEDVIIDEIKEELIETAIENALENIILKTTVKQGARHGHKFLKKEALNKMSGKVAARFGSRRLLNISKAIPFLGGIVGGTMDAYSTHQIGKRAKQMFLS